MCADATASACAPGPIALDATKRDAHVAHASQPDTASFSARHTPGATPPDILQKGLPMASIGSFDNDFGSTVSNAGSAVGDKAANIGDRARDVADNLGQKASQYASRAQQGVMHAKDVVTERYGDLSRQSRQAVRDNPLAAVAIGIGIGFILGRILFR